MIDEKTKKKLIKELSKEGNIFVACIKVGIDRTTPYRWIKKDKKFGKEFRETIRTGRANANDITEHMLMHKIKKGDSGLIKYQLSHNHPNYKPKKKADRIVIEHIRTNKLSPIPRKTLEDLIDDDEEKIQKRAMSINEKYEKIGGIPPKSDGSKIKFEELEEYEMYIKEWYKKKELEKTKSPTDIEDSKSLKDNSLVNPQESHKVSDASLSNPSNHHDPPDSNS